MSFSLSCEELFHQWGPAEQASFDQLKACLTTAPVLRTIDSSRRSILTTDASEKAISAVLAQPNYDGVHHPVAYKSRKLTAAEQAYPAHVLELLAVVHAFRVFRHYLLGSGPPRPPRVRSDFTLRTDNQAVTWLADGGRGFQGLRRRGGCDGTA